MNNIEDILRRLSLKQLEALAVFIPTGERASTHMSIETASNTIHTAVNDNIKRKKAIGGVISTLCKIETPYGKLILPAAWTKEEGMRWTLNEKVINRQELKEILLQIPGLNI